ncbi:TonB-dependent receptor [Pseudomaricurvus alkylphenolicus]|uniref:TonB-dependent receptor n=1 Tax=Pseudomaricurvus alkylphenolicus TaxID=1306991 RepID=UPI00142070F1|nr:TonB-dependent receptor [Pseudomaricurvus alkylphenolicus]NIB43397.1 TonB-dependent receptor [Pseudomaricurvus alkylphenolicus]
MMKTSRRYPTKHFPLSMLTLSLMLANHSHVVAEDELFSLEEIVVTAQRKEEGLQDAAIAIDVATGEDLVEAGITDMARLEELSPGLTIQPTSNGNLIFIRGVGNFTVTANSDPASAFNYDGVYVARPTSSTGVFYDLDRVEILKGPQGTLYGRNATGGAINVIPTRPQLGETGGYLTASVGTLDGVDADAVTVEGAVNVSLNDANAVRLSGSYVDQDPTFEDGTNDNETQALRMQWLSEVSPDLTVRVSGDYARKDDVGTSVTYLGRYAFNPYLDQYAYIPSGLSESEGLYSDQAQAFRQQQLAGPSGRLGDTLDHFPFQDNQYYGLHAEIEYETDLGTVTLQPAWRKSELDYLSSAAAFLYRQKQSDEQFSFEARIAGTRGIVDYIVGAYYYEDSTELDTSLTLSAVTSFLDTDYSTESYATFARLTANITEDFRLVAAVRYTEDNKETDDNVVGGSIICTTLTLGIPCFDAPLFPLVDSPDDIPFPFPATGMPPVPVGERAIAIRNETHIDDDLSNDKVTYRLGVEYNLAEQSLLYASVETGYRSGGFNSGAIGFESFDPEYITAFTLGSKNRLYDDRLQLNLEAFYWEYEDQQVSHVGLDAAGRTTNITENIGKSEIRGIEIETKFLLTPDTLLSADVHYLDAENTAFEYQNPDVGLPPNVGCDMSLAEGGGFWDIDCTGKPAFNSPKWTVNLGVEQSFTVFKDFELTASLDSQYKSGSYSGFNYLKEQYRESFWLTNASLKLTNADESWSVSAYVRNIEGDRTPNYISATPVLNYLVSGVSLPRNYGLRFFYQF